MARDEKDYGEPISYNPNFKGPIHRRSCTDLLCLFLFLFVMAGWVVVSVLAITKGDIFSLIAPTDSNGKKCGLTTQVQDKPYLFFFDVRKCLSPSSLVSGCPTYQMCVEKCPTKTILYDDLDKYTWNEIKEHVYCKIDKNSISSIADYKQKINDNQCARDVFESKPVSRRCLIREFSDLQRIQVTKDNIEILEDNMNALAKTKEMGTMLIEDLVNLKYWLLGALLIVMLICLIYIVIMRWIAGPVVWFSILGVMGLLSYSIYLTYKKYEELKNNPVVIKPPGSNLSAVGEQIAAEKTTWLILLIIACILLAIILLTVIFLRKRIVIAIALIKEGSRAVGSIKSTLFFPLFPWIFQALTIALVVIVGMYLSAVGDLTFKAVNDPATCPACNYTQGQDCNPEIFNQQCGGCEDSLCHYTGIHNPGYIGWLHAYNVVAFFWLIFFLEGLGEMILAGAFATWYWTFKKSDVPFFTLTISITRTFCNNLGTIAFGSLLITICRLIRILLEYIEAKTKNVENVVSKVFLCLCKCCFACLESFLKFINKNAYIMCSIHGKPFLSSAKDAFNLLMRNILRVFVLDKVTDFLFFMSKLLVSIGCGVIAYYSLKNPTAVETYTGENLVEIHYDVAAPVIVGLCAYFIASVFFGVYSMAVDTLFLCFLEDCERNDGSPDRPYFMSKRLMKILGKKNKI